MSSKIDSLIGKNLKKLRIQSGFSLKELAVVFGVTFQQLQKYESGKNKIPVSKLYLFSEIFEIPIELFFEGIKKGETSNPPKSKLCIDNCRKVINLDSPYFQKSIRAFLNTLNEIKKE